VSDQDGPRARFVWGKKIERDIVERGKGLDEFKGDAEKRRMEERLREIEKVKELRAVRERERLEREAEKELENRQKTYAEAAELDAKEDAFHLANAVKRSEIRLSEHRAKPIDVLVKNILLGGQFGLDTSAPYRVFADLNLEECEELCKEIAELAELDRADPLHREYWGALRTVAGHELEAQQRAEEAERNRMRGVSASAPAGLAPGIEDDVQEMLQGKNYAELQELEAEVAGMLGGGEADDPEYWGAVLSRLRVHVAKARVREIHADILDRHLAQQGATAADTDLDVGALRDARAREAEAALLAEAAAGAGAGAGVGSEEIALDDEDAGGPSAVPAGMEAEGGGEIADALPNPEELGIALDGDGGGEGGDGDAGNDEEIDIGDPDGGEGAVAAEERGRSAEREPRARGRWSPEPVRVPAGAEVVSAAEDQRELGYLRAQVRFRAIQRFRAASAAAAMQGGAAGGAAAVRDFREGRKGGPAPAGGAGAAVASAEGDSGAETDKQGRVLQALAVKMMSGQEDAGGDLDMTGRSEVALASQVYWWHDKYKPRKPKYFNRVHTGFEWTKYNKAHYDSDNMPPKVVQGYKFNIFYPDLIDKSKTPSYVIEKDPGSAEGSTCIIRFKAGAPYEDIAFRIVNKEWEYTHKRGFKCLFDRGILHLYFSFRRPGYRR